MPGGSITGVVGSIAWHYYTAAAINGYTVTRTDEAGWRLAGTIVLADAYKMAQRPLTFVAPHAKGEWRWPIETLELADGRVFAHLGPPEP
jgi:hypothetical protein